MFFFFLLNQLHVDVTAIQIGAISALQCIQKGHSSSQYIKQMDLVGNQNFNFTDGLDSVQEVLLLQIILFPVFKSPHSGEQLFKPDNYTAFFLLNQSFVLDVTVAECYG